MCVLAWELTGAVIGAGMASGREIASFFGRYGGWGIAGIGLSVIIMPYLSDAEIPHAWQGRWPERSWHLLRTLLLVCTGGAMLSGSGEMLSLSLPITGSYWFGIVITMVFAWCLTRYTASGLACVSKLIFALMLFVLVYGLSLPKDDAAYLPQQNPMAALGSGITYGGFNAALQQPIVMLSPLSKKERRRASCHASVIVGLVLLLGYAVLQKHRILLDEALPFIAMLRNAGKLGYLLGFSCLYFAILSTLTACVRSLNAAWFPVTAMLLLSTIGLTEVVQIAYPLLGGGFMLMMAASKLTNCRFPPFHSGKYML